MIWVVVFAGWFVAFAMLMGTTSWRELPLPVFSALVTALVLGFFVNIPVGIIFAAYTWRLPKLLDDMRLAVLSKRRRREAYDLIILISNGVSANDPVYATLRNAREKLPPLIKPEVEQILAARALDASYSISDALIRLGEKWDVPELQVCGQLSEISTQFMGSDAATAFANLTKQIRARDKRRADMLRNLTELVLTSWILLIIAGVVVLFSFLVSASRHMFLTSLMGYIVLIVASVFFTGALYMVESLWYRENRMASAAI